MEIPTDHWSGTMVYHSHKHGAAAMQTMGGIAGMIIVEDTPKAESPWLPDIYRDAKEVKMVMATVQPAVLLHMAFNMNETIMMGNEEDHPLCDAVGADWIPAGGNCTLGGNPIGADCTNSCVKGGSRNRDFTLVNSQLRPLIEMDTGVFQRWRIAYLSAKRYINLVVTADNSTLLPSPDCELQLIAKGTLLDRWSRTAFRILHHADTNTLTRDRCGWSPWER